jgi:phage terminase small subunit
MLTAKQEQFALSIAEGTTQADAYRQAYDASGMKDGTVWSEAARLMRRPHVTARVEELRAEAEVVRQGLLMSREEAILGRLEHEAMTAKTDSARIRALELLGRHAGMFTERVEVEQVDRSVAQIEADILARLQRLGWS